MPHDSTQPEQQSQQPKKKKQGQTVSEFLKQKEARAVTAAACQTDSVTALYSNTTNSALMCDTEISQPTVACTSLSAFCSETCTSSSLESAVLLSDVSSASCSASQGSQSLPPPATAATVCEPQNGINSSHTITSSCGLTSDSLGSLSSQHSVAVSEASLQQSGVSTLTASMGCTKAICSLLSTVAISSSPALTLLPSFTRHCPALVSTTAVPTYRVTERVTGGTVLVDMDIGSNVLGSGLVCGTFVYHGGRLVLGQQRQNNSAISAWPLLSDIHSPVYFLAAPRPVVAPSTNIYAVTVPSEALVNGLRVVCDGISNVIDDGRLPVNVSNIQLPVNVSNIQSHVQSHTSSTTVAVEYHTSNSLGINTSHSAVGGSSELLGEPSQLDMEPSNTDADHTEEMAGVPVTSRSSTDVDHSKETVNNNSKSCSPATMSAAISAVHSHQGPVHAHVITAEPCELEGINKEVVTRSATLQSVPYVSEHVLVSLSEMQQATNIRSGPATSSSVVANNEFVVSKVSVTSQFGIAVLSCADVLASSTSSCVSTTSLSGDSAVRCDAASGKSTDTAPAAASKQARQRGTKRKSAAQAADECPSKTKIGRMDSSQKRISKYICPPPDSASDKDSKIIHVMDRLCDKSVEQYLCSVQHSASSQHVAADLIQSTSEDHVSMVNVIPSITAHVCNSTGLSTASVPSIQPISLDREETTIPFSTSLSSRNLSDSQLQTSHVNLRENSSRYDGVASSHGKGFTLANFLSITTASNVLITSLSQQSSLLDSIQASTNDQMEKTGNSLLAEPVQTQNHNFTPVNRIGNSTITCDSASNMLPDDLSLTDNDFAMILSDTDDSMFSIPSRKSADSNYWSLGFGSVCGRLPYRGKDGLGIESLHASAEDLCHSVIPMFREQNCLPETDYVISDHIDLGNKVGFNVSSLTCKTTSVCNSSSSVPTANSFSNSTSSANTLCQTSVNVPFSYSLSSHHNEILLDQTNSHGKLQDANPRQTSKEICSAVQSSTRGIFSLAHHAIQPASKSFNPNSSSSNEIAQSASVLWSPCNGNAHKSSFSSDSTLSEHRQSLNFGRQCRRPSSAMNDVHWRMPEPSNFAPLYNSWSDNLYCTVQPLARPRPFVDQTVNAQPAACSMQSKTPFPKIHSVSETDRENLHGRWSGDDFCPFVSNKNTVGSSKNVHANCQYSSHQKVSDSSSSQPLWTYSERGIAPHSYLSTSRGWLPTNSAVSGPAMTFDLPLSVPATSCLSASTCRLPSFSFATVPPVPDFLSLSFTTTAASINAAAATGSEVSAWPVTLTATTGSTGASCGWSPLFPQHTALQSRHVVSTSSSSVTPLTTMSSTQRQETRPDVTYTVPSFVHTDKEARKQPSSFNTHLPSYTLWYGTDHVPVEMCHLPPVSMIHSDAQVLQIHGRGLYSNNEAGFITNTLASPPLHHHPVYCNQQAGIHATGEKQVAFEPPFSLPRLPLASQVLNFSTSFETGTPSASAMSSETYHDPAFNVGNIPVQIRTTEDARHSQNVSHSHRTANLKRPSKYPKQLKHNATSLCVGYPAIQNGALSRSVVADVPTYLPAGPFVGSTLDQKSHSAEYQSFGSVFGSCSLRHGLAGEFPKSLGVAPTDPQTTVSNQRHNFDIGAFISELSSNSSQAVTAPAAIRRLDFPTPPVHVLQQPVIVSEHYQPQMECNQSHSDHASHSFGLHSMSINSLLGDNPYSGFTHRYEVCSDTANHSTSTLPAFDVPTLNFSIRSQTPAVNFERPHNTKARHS